MISLPYGQKGRFTESAGVFSGENLLTFTTLKGMFDPEAIFTKNDYTAEGGKNYPMNKVISFGLVVNL